MAGPAEGLLRTPAFWGMSATQKRAALEKADPRFQSLSEDQVQTFLVKKQSSYMPTALTAPRDIVGRLKAHLVAEPPLGGRTLFGETDIPGRVIRALGDLFLPETLPETAGLAATLPIGGGGGAALRGAQGLRRLAQGVTNVGGGLFSGAAARTAAGGAAAGLTELAVSGDIEKAGESAGGFAARQGIGEVLPGGIRAGLYAKRGAEEIAKAKAKTAFNKSMTEAFTETEKAAHATALERQKVDYAAVKSQHAERAAEHVAESFKAEVPPWRGYPSSTKGLLDMVYGTGQEKLSKFFDAELKTTQAAAAGKKIALSLEDALDLNLRAADVNPGGAVRADAAEVVGQVIGKWKKNPALYRRVVSALMDEGVGNEEARNAYRAGQALIAFTDKTQMLKGEAFNPELAQAGFTKLKTINELRKRGEGNIFAGPVSQAIRGNVPPAPPPALLSPPLRVTPPPTEPKGITTGQFPRIPHPFWTGGAVAELPFALMGQHRFAAPFLAGGAAAAMLSGKPYVSQAPISSLVDTLLRVEPWQAGQVIRQTLEDLPSVPTP